MEIFVEMKSMAHTHSEVLLIHREEIIFRIRELDIRMLKEITRLE